MAGNPEASLGTQRLELSWNVFEILTHRALSLVMVFFKIRFYFRRKLRSASAPASFRAHENSQRGDDEWIADVEQCNIHSNDENCSQHVQLKSPQAHVSQTNVTCTDRKTEYLRISGHTSLIDIERSRQQEVFFRTSYSVREARGIQDTSLQALGEKTIFNR